jgi:hypothetical protein
VSFLYPTIYVNRRAQAVREQELDRMRVRIRELEARARDPAEHASTDEVAKRQEIQRLREEFHEYATVSLYPLSVGISRGWPPRFCCSSSSPSSSCGSAVSCEVPPEEGGSP